MARRRITVPSIADIKQRDGIGTTARIRQVPTVGVRSTNGQGSPGSTGEARTGAQAPSYETALAIEAAKQGDDTELLPYQPTPSINPPRPRTLAAGYDKDSRTLRIRFRDGPVYEYYNVSVQEWSNFCKVKSPGKWINRVANHHPYARVPWQ